MWLQSGKLPVQVKKNHTYFLDLISLQGRLFVHLCTASSLPLLDRSVEVQVQQPGGVQEHHSYFLYYHPELTSKRKGQL